MLDHIARDDEVELLTREMLREALRVCVAHLCSGDTLAQPCQRGLVDVDTHDPLRRPSLVVQLLVEQRTRFPVRKRFG